MNSPNNVELKIVDILFLGYLIILAKQSTGSNCQRGSHKAASSRVQSSRVVETKSIDSGECYISNNKMKAETSLLPSEPPTHTHSKHCRQCFFCEDYSLSHEELQSFYTLKTQSNILFEHQERWDLVESLYSEYFKEPPKRSGKEWMRLGFQGQYPETDFRGGGVLSLQLILRFLKRNRALVQVMEQDQAGFFFAITAINIAFYMKKYFHLADFLVQRKDANVYCNRRALKNFCRVLQNNEEAYFQIHEALLKHFYNNIWVSAGRQNSQTLLLFNSLFDQLVARLRSTFEDYDLDNLQDFTERFSSL